MPGYVLAPEVRIAAITAMVADAIAAAAAEVAGPIRLAGHSAGGHLVARQVCDDGGLPAGGRGAGRRVVSISGAARPAAAAADPAQRRALRLDAAEAAAESPALRLPRPGRAGACLGRRRRAAGIRAAGDAARQHLDRARRRHGADDRAAAAPFRRDRRADAPGARAWSRRWSGTRSDEQPGAGGGDRRRRRRLLGALSPREGRLDRRDADRAVGADQRLVLARGRRVPHAERRSERRQAAGLHRRALPRAGGAVRASPAGCT